MALALHLLWGTELLDRAATLTSRPVVSMLQLPYLMLLVKSRDGLSFQFGISTWVNTTSHVKSSSSPLVDHVYY